MSTRTPRLSPEGYRELAVDVASTRMPLVYNQSWEDPAVDLPALAPGPGQVVLTIASGGCNVLHLALTGARVLAIDRNPAQIALTEAKVAAARQLPAEKFRRLFSTGRDSDDDLKRVELSPGTRRLVFERGWFQGRGLYAAGVFGLGCALLRMWVRMCGASGAVETMFDAQDLASQAAAWREVRRRIRGPTGSAMLATPLPLLLFGGPLKVWRQVQQGSTAFANWVDHTLTRLPAGENWFWQRAFLDEYRTASPHYLHADMAGLGPVQTQVAALESVLASSLPNSFDLAVLLDAMYWVSPRNRLTVWLDLHRALCPGGRVTVRRFSESAGAPAALFEEVPLDSIDRTGCYAGASLLIRR